MTGAPIYLVSACATGEEFVAAFRRYADKNGLFVPISEPFPVGCRARVAVTLKDGGVMIEGDAEVITAARTVSVLHGRVGMTLRFLEPDPSSKTMLSELERARLAMKPPPPSVSPRPANIPAEPRPVPPPVQGRVDAVNALAECVAIGAASVLGSGSCPPATPPKAGARFVVPTVPSRPTTPPLRNPGPSSDTLVAAAPPTPPTPPSTAIPDTPPDPPPAMAPAAMPRTTIPPRTPASPATRTHPPVLPARHAAEMPVVVPRTATRPGHAPAPTRERTTMDPGVAATAVPGFQSTTPQSAPTDIGGVLVEPLPPTDPAALASDGPGTDPGMDPAIDLGFGPPTERVLVATLAPTTDPAFASATKPPIQIVASTVERDDPSARTQIHAGVPPREPAGLSSQPALLEIDLAEPTDLSVGPPMPLTEPRRTVLGVAVVPTGIERAGSTRPISQQLAPPLDDLTPIDWAMTSSPPADMAIEAAAAAGPGELGGSLPNGDWTIALDPQSVDGWSEPVVPPGVSPGVPRGAAVAVSARAPATRTQRRDELPNELPIIEPKVQIDPTLIEPPIDPARAGEPLPLAHGMLGRTYGGSRAGVAESHPDLASRMAMTTPPPGSFMLPHGQLMTPDEAPAYATDPGYQRALMSVPPPGAVVGFGGGLGDAQYTDAIARSSRRRAVIVIASAAVAVAIGIAVLAALTSGRDPGADSGSSGSRRPLAPAIAPPAAAEPAPSMSPTAVPATPAPSPANASSAAEAAPPPMPAPSACFAELSSSPTGAEIVIDHATVLGTTPARLTLPCSPVELVFRKGRLAQVTRTVTPTPGGAKLKVTLLRQSVLVRVSSVPEGATITLNGRPLGVTPTTVKVPAFELSSLLLTKEGYEAATEAVAPKGSGATIRTRLKKLDGS